jgi:SAM-dependent methyltransferase
MMLPTIAQKTTVRDSIPAGNGRVVLSASDLDKRLHRIAADVFERDSGDYDPFLGAYCGGLGNELDSAKYVRHVLDLLDLAGVTVAGKSVLDVGCGFGFALVLCGLLDARELHGLEIHEGMIRTIESYRDVLPSPLPKRLEISRGDAAHMPFEDERFDVVLSIEAVSHYLEVERFTAEAARVLKPGGVLIVSDGNNGLNPLIRRRNHRIWKAFECGPSDRYVDGYPIGACYEDRRRAFIDARCPAVAEGDRVRLARETCAMTYAEVADACDRFVGLGIFPGRSYRAGAMAIDPDGSVPERLIQPYQLAQVLRLSGLESRVYGYWGGANGKRFIRIANRCLMRLSRLTVFTARAFRVVGVKGTALSDHARTG